MSSKKESWYVDYCHYDFWNFDNLSLEIIDFYPLK
jgi:hypothetical protein